jgi:hypothetical protein
LLPWWCGVLLIVAFPARRCRERYLQFRRGPWHLPRVWMKEMP